jgi:hypothetical protein
LEVLGSSLPFEEIFFQLLKVVLYDFSDTERQLTLIELYLAIAGQLKLDNVVVVGSIIAHCLVIMKNSIHPPQFVLRNLAI